jgi:hypothetical protein
MSVTPFPNRASPQRSSGDSPPNEGVDARVRERIAVITVHGVADQIENKTAQELAKLLEADCADRYGFFEQTPLVLPVLPRHGRRFGGDGTPERDWFHSAFTAGHLEEKKQEEKEEQREQQEQQEQEQSHVRKTVEAPYDIAYSESFSATIDLEHKERSYSTVRLRGERHAIGEQRTQTIDIYELYWADLSRLSNSFLRIGQALYQLFFHLAYLAKTVIAHARNASQRPPEEAARWRVLHVAHGASEWVLTRPMALFNLYQFVLSLALAALFLPADLRDAVGLAVFAGLGIGTIILVHWRLGFWAVPVCFIVLGAAAYSGYSQLVAIAERPEWVFATMLVLATIGYAFIVASLAERIRGVGAFGFFWPVFVVSAAAFLPREAFSNPEHEMVVFAVRAMEINVYALMLASLLLVVSNAVIYLTGLYIGLRGGARKDADRGTIATARLGIFMACILFTMLTLTASGLVVSLAQSLWPAIEYHPLFASSGESTMMLDHFVARVMQIRATSFGPLASFLGLTIALSLYALGLSLFREIKPKPALIKSDVVGDWLTHGLRLLSLWLAIVFFVYAILAVFVQLHSMHVLSDPANRSLMLETSDFDFLIKLLAGSAVTIIALSSRIGFIIRSLRSVLDIFLDVDNYFKDRPAKLTPRGRIFARYTALLEHIAKHRFADGSTYDRVVIVAHSQGTVITADLLRMMAHSGALARLLGERPLHLLTAGCPLRQLYAARFPDLYPWVVEEMAVDVRSGNTTGPDPRSLSVARWTNVYQSGDYVGRHLWMGDKRPACYSVPDTAEDEHAIFKPAHATAEIREMCVGSGAHIHYFDGNAKLVAGEVDRLIGTR